MRRGMEAIVTSQGIRRQGERASSSSSSAGSGEEEDAPETPMEAQLQRSRGGETQLYNTRETSRRGSNSANK